MNRQLTHIHITECPRDAMQGIKEWIPTEQKVAYLNALLSCGFDVLDFGSFVSPKTIPQMQDTAAVLSELAPSPTELLAIVANTRGAASACSYPRISIVGYPFSISETFQLRNTNSNSEEALRSLHEISDLCKQNNKQLRVYLSMGFGNPYGDAWSPELVSKWVKQLSSLFDIAEFALSDTIGCATPDNAKQLFRILNEHFPTIKFAAHLHVKPGDEAALIQACIDGGCLHFDTAIGGYGGCPMAKDDLTGNLATEALLGYLNKNDLSHAIQMNQLNKAIALSTSIF
jgi:hydroxymethylglutaryl-CoA lyase